jgi:hypothetical protein
MLTITVTKLAKTQNTIDVQVTVSSATPQPGIQDIKLKAIDGSTVDSHVAAGCPQTQTYSVKGIALFLLPLYVDATECQVGVDQGQAVGVTTSGGPFLSEEIGIVPCKSPGNNVMNPACATLQSQIQMLRNQILTECPQLATLQSQSLTALAVALAAISIASVLAYIASVTPWPVNIGFTIAAAAAAAVAGAAALAWWILKLQADALAQQMTQQRAALSTLIGRLKDVCCPEFVYVEQDVPLCP